jgi:hypothetical protein
MPELDLEKFTGKAANIIADYILTFVGILHQPEQTLRRTFAKCSNRTALIKAIVFTSVSLTLGLAVAEFLHLPGAKVYAAPSTILAVISVWFVGALVLAGLMRLFSIPINAIRAGITFLFISSALHVVWILIVSLCSSVVTDTRVRLTYDYAVLFGEGMPRLDRKEEEYVAEEEPEKEGTVLTEAVPGQFTGSETGKRIRAEQSRLPLPKREVTKTANAVGWYLCIGYYVIASWFLSKGFAAITSVSAMRLYVFALVVPATVGVIAVVVWVLAIVYF